MTSLSEDLPALRASDAVNLADVRVPCPRCQPSLLDTPNEDAYTECPDCHDRYDMPAPTGRETLSHSKLSRALACWRKYEFSYEQRLERVERSVPRELGKAFHHALEQGSAGAGADWLYVHAPEDRDQQAEDELTLNMATVSGLAYLYLERYGSVAKREFEYLVRLRSPWTGAPSLTFDLHGYVDGLEDRGDYYHLTENKLAGQITATSVRRLPLDRQLALECYGVWRATGKPVRTVSFRWARKPSIRVRQNESVGEFVKRLAADFLERPDFYLVEETLIRTDEDLVRIEAELWEWAEELRARRLRNFFPRNSSMCHEFGGCDFIPLCVGDPDAHALYRERPPRTREEVPT